MLSMLNYQERKCMEQVSKEMNVIVHIDTCSFEMVKNDYFNGMYIYL